MSARSRAIRERERDIAATRARLERLGDKPTAERRVQLLELAHLVAQGEHEAAKHASGHDDRMRFRARETSDPRHTTSYAPRQLSLAPSAPPRLHVVRAAAEPKADTVTIPRAQWDHLVQQIRNLREWCAPDLRELEAYLALDDVAFQAFFDRNDPPPGAYSIQYDRLEAVREVVMAADAVAPVPDGPS